VPKKSEVPVPQRREAVLALLRREEPATQLARRYGVSEPTLYRWRDEFLAGGEAALKNGAGGSGLRRTAGTRRIVLVQPVTMQTQ
jgi:transposase-like protein